MRKLIQIFVLLSFIGLNNYSFGQTFEKMSVDLTGAGWSTEAGAGPIQCGDFNSDGKMDLVIQGTGVTYTNLFINNGDFTFSNANPPSYQMYIIN